MRIESGAACWRGTVGYHYKVVKFPANATTTTTTTTGEARSPPPPPPPSDLPFRFFRNRYIPWPSNGRRHFLRISTSRASSLPHKALRSIPKTRVLAASRAMKKEQELQPKLCTKMRLWEFSDQYMIEAIDGASNSYLMISRVDGSLKSVDELPDYGATSPRIRNIFGLIGMLKLVAGTYALVITNRECVGSHFGYPIFKVSSLQILPCNQAVSSSTAEQNKLESELKGLLSAAEKTPGLYFSYEIDLTLSLQRSHGSRYESKNLPLWRQAILATQLQYLDPCSPSSLFLVQADPRFLWNNYMLEVLIDNKLDPYILPVIQGNILSFLRYQSFQANIGKQIVDVILIARRCTRRTGTRMWRRGADAEGYTANFVETEQIVQCNGFTASFVQVWEHLSFPTFMFMVDISIKAFMPTSVRGSIPLLWKQIVDLTYKPSFEIVRPEEAPQVVQRHFLDLRRTYGSVLAVDLINKHGGEGRLNQVFANAMQKIASDEIRYVHFDFHRICGHIHFERLSLLYDQIVDFLKSHRYFLLDVKGEKLEEQQGIVRTNCVDCLDRTNVTQSMIGRRILESQLQRMGILGNGETIDNHVGFDESFKILWADHGDDISIQYSGTAALKGDFVRHGKRTINGVIGDGCNALLRYYLNNFCDGTKQDAIDLLHGHYIVAVSRGLTSSLKGEAVEAWTSFPIASALVLTGMMLAAMSLRQAQHDWRHLLLSAVWAGLSLGIMAFMKANGRKFCNRPRLHKP
ncbi:Phosphoinositide phosphatase [Nymphaea thermarum]|nr:Phosphoinositide phosphatase [Nymphaea thermarum]